MFREVLGAVGKPPSAPRLLLEVSLSNAGGGALRVGVFRSVGCITPRWVSDIRLEDAP